MPEEFEYYIPLQCPKLFEYTEREGIANILSSIRVDLHARESIEIREPVYKNECSFSMELRVIEDLEEEEDYEWRGGKLIPVIFEPCYPDTVTDPAEKKAAVKNKLEDLLQRNNSTFFLVNIKVLPPPGKDGGEVTNTINGGSPVEIDVTRSLSSGVA